jgi:beta-glucosidase/6-phospho-beta-glucosidase/beta-galactosidase
MPYTEAGLVEGVVRAYRAHWDVPLMIAETASYGPVARRLGWLARSVAAVRALRAEGVPLAGYTWWPMFALVAWAWRQGRADVARHLLQMGLWDLDAGLERVPTALVDAYRALAAEGARAAGPIGG